MTIDPVAYLSRVIHIFSAIVLLGGFFYAWNLSKQGASGGGPAVGFRSGVWLLLVGLLVSGLYNLLNKAALPNGYHMIFGIKFLLFLHIAAVSLLLVKPGQPEEKRRRMLTGLVMSGGAVVMLSGLLRSLTL